MLKSVVTSVTLYLLAFGVIVAAAKVAHVRADIRLQWVGPHDCGKPANFPTQVAELLTSDAYRLPQVVQARAFVQRDALAKWLLHLTMAIRDDAGRTRYEGVRVVALDSCEEVKEAVVLVAALAVDSVVTDDLVHDGPADKKPETQIQLKKVSSRKSSVSFDIGAGMDLWIGALPKVRPSMGLSAGLTMARLFVDITTSFGFSQRQVLPFEMSVGGDFQMMIGTTVRACWVIQVWGAEVGPCTAVAGALIRGTGVNLLTPQTSYYAWVGILGGGTAALRIGGKWWVRINAALGGALTTSRFEIEDVGLVHQNQIFTAQVASQLELRFQ